MLRDTAFWWNVNSVDTLISLSWFHLAKVQADGSCASCLLNEKEWMPSFQTWKSFLCEKECDSKNILTSEWVGQWENDECFMSRFTIPRSYRDRNKLVISLNGLISNKIVDIGLFCDWTCLVLEWPKVGLLVFSASPVKHHTTGMFVVMSQPRPLSWFRDS